MAVTIFLREVENEEKVSGECPCPRGVQKNGERGGAGTKLK